MIFLFLLERKPFTNKIYNHMNTMIAEIIQGNQVNPVREKEKD
jgi:hypothetical protein